MVGRRASEIFALRFLHLIITCRTKISHVRSTVNRWYICMRCLGLGLCVFYFITLEVSSLRFLYLISRQAETSRVR